MVSVDFFTVPTVTFRILYVFLVLQHSRRLVAHFNTTEHPTAQWTAQQMIEAFPWDSAPHYLLRDRDNVRVVSAVSGEGVPELLEDVYGLVRRSADEPGDVSAREDADGGTP